MINVIRSEWIKLRTVRMNLVLLIIAIAFPLLICSLTAAFSESDSVSRRDVYDLATGSSIITALLLGVIAAVSISGEFGHNTIRPTFAATPNRIRVIVAKGIVTAGTSAIAMAIVIAVCVPVTFTILGGTDGRFDDESFSPWPSMLGIVVFAAIVSVLGFALGMLIRNTPAAIAVLILWPLIAEPLVGGLLGLAGVDRPFRFMPYNAGLQITTSGTSTDFFGRVPSGLYFAAVTLVLTVAGAALTNRRDA